MATASFAEDVGGAIDVRGFGDLQARLRAMSYHEVRVAHRYNACTCTFASSLCMVLVSNDRLGFLAACHR